ncbi:SRPBCC family protein [Runella sp. SP2]|uniref:SRPBCC family protein n=1 Tax=Runella sp. SP2 TaxID=2268026 RepID=UPI000F08A747|nr:SRPBCC family protein [Runella sp. SP2]AYQ33311.1 SRPBCC family protein [Runella sp. SP2]
MSKFTTTHEINCTPDRFWTIFFDKPTIENLYLNSLGVIDIQVVNQSELSTRFFQKLGVKPKMNFPDPLAKLIGEEYRYTEEGTLDKTSNLFTWKWTPSTLVDKLKIEGVLRVQPIGDSKVRLISDVTVEIKVFGVGSLMDSVFEKQIRTDNEAKAVFYNQLTAG